ncbi:hypothetical protein QQY66_25500 [Streptomyces sp. DG2A-72]|uniref:hypothetical protein n=1 Tax=Streptomyces sp. DG2A-72 TaxID=3051386 RepID=UPI00265C314E|nr:hypothetical protein [Streptomyces sp. DG2A-72]MDO0934868.1 hypothetical protein [Streptomyces sp. DG2A-72]
MVGPLEFLTYGDSGHLDAEKIAAIPVLAARASANCSWTSVSVWHTPGRRATGQTTDPARDTAALPWNTSRKVCEP